MPISQDGREENVNYMRRQYIEAFGSISNPTYTPNNRNHPNFSYKTLEPIPPGFPPGQPQDHQISFDQMGYEGQHRNNQQMQGSYQRNQGYNQTFFANQNNQPAPKGHTIETKMTKLEAIIIDLLARQDKMDTHISKLIRVSLEINIRNKMLETQIAQQASISSRAQGRLPSNKMNKQTHHVMPSLRGNELSLNSWCQQGKKP